MKMEIKKELEEYILQIEPITQICGTNYYIKSYIRESVIKHFSNHKYLLFEEKMINNVTMCGKNIGREYFDVIQINDRYDLIENIKMSKNSIMQEYTEEILHSYDNQKEIEILKDELDRVSFLLNQELKINGIEIDFEMNDIFKIVSKSNVLSDDGKSPEEMSNIELTIVFLNILSKLQKIKPAKRLVIFNNIDMMVSSDDYISIAKEAIFETKSSDTWFMFFVGMENYLFLDEEYFKGINVVNSEIFSMPEYDKMLEFFISEYPRNIDINFAKDIITLLPLIVHKIGDKNCNIDIVSMVALQILNASLGIKTINNKEKNNELEKEYLNF